MEPNDNELNIESISTEEKNGMLPEGRYNLEICPNCLEPNDEDLAVCRYCGQPLSPDAEVIDTAALPEDEKTLAENRAAAVPEKKPQKKQENGFRRVMPWIGLYLIYYAVTGVIETAHTVTASRQASD